MIAFLQSRIAIPTGVVLLITGINILGILGTAMVSGRRRP